jgi:hypothetical protein
MFLFLDKKLKQLSRWLKEKTTIDFSDWGVLFLLLSGFIVILKIEFLSESLKIARIDLTGAQKLSVLVLWFTAIIIVQYTKETYWLKQISQKQLKHQRENSLRPIILRSGFINNWGDIRFRFVNNKLEQGKPLEFTILRNIAKDISGYIIIDKKKYRLLFANKISQIDFNGQENISDLEKRILKKLYEEYKKIGKLFKWKISDACAELNISNGDYVGVLNNSKYIKLEGDDLLITDEGIRHMDTKTDHSLYYFGPSWGWMNQDSLLYAIYNDQEVEEVDEENQIHLTYKDIEGNKYCTIEDKNFSQSSYKLKNQ